MVHCIILKTNINEIHVDITVRLTSNFTINVQLRIKKFQEQLDFTNPTQLCCCYTQYTKVLQ